MSPPKKSSSLRRSRAAQPRGRHDGAPSVASPVSRRTSRELDQLELIATMRKADEEGRAKLRAAIVDAFSCDSGRALVAFGKLLHFVAPPRGRR